MIFRSTPTFVGWISAVLVLTLGGQSIAATCPQKQAVYADEDQTFTLQFTSPKEGSGIATNTFKLMASEGNVGFDGWVVWNNGISRPNGVVTYKCPDGDITGDELDACKVWEGVIYSVFKDGEVDLLPPADDPAVESLLFPDLGRALRASQAWSDAKLSTVPWDHFKFQSCQTKP